MRQKRGWMLHRWGGFSQRWRRPMRTWWHHSILYLDRTRATGGGTDDDDGGCDGYERAPEASHSHVDRTTMEDRNISMLLPAASEPFFFCYVLFFLLRVPSTWNYSLLSHTLQGLSETTLSVSSSSRRYSLQFSWGRRGRRPVTLWRRGESNQWKNNFLQQGQNGPPLKSFQTFCHVMELWSKSGNENVR